MIKINLLPFRAARQKENIRRQVSIFILLMLLTLAALVFVTVNLNRKIDTLKDRTETIKKDVKQYKAKADKVKKIKKNLSLLEKKLKIIANLNKNRKKPLELTDSMTQLLVHDRMWIRSLKSTNKAVTISGIAFDNPTIAEFMKKLESYPDFRSIKLKSSKNKRMGKNIILKQFQLTCNKKTAKKKPKKKKKR
ncbi:MAG: pilus assembly protein PilN [Desulfobacteraceae bacterium]|nr:MAG: pilus assembly protein PilN [Desulfobacteraceae bacterium]